MPMSDVPVGPYVEMSAPSFIFSHIADPPVTPKGALPGAIWLATQPAPAVSFGMTLKFVFFGIQQWHLAASTPGVYWLSTRSWWQLASVQYTQGASHFSPPPVKESLLHVPFWSLYADGNASSAPSPTVSGC